MPSKRVRDAFKKKNNKQKQHLRATGAAIELFCQFTSCLLQKHKNQGLQEHNAGIGKEGQERKLTALLFVKLRTARALTSDSKFYTLSSYNRTKLQDLLQTSDSQDCRWSLPVPAMSQQQLPARCHTELQDLGILRELLGQ